MPSQPINPTWDATYQLKVAKNPKELAILLHGWQQRGDYILKNLQHCFTEETVVLAPDAPYPAPQASAGGYRQGFGWYFFDPHTNIYAVDMSLAKRFVETLVTALGYSHLPKRIVGFSQGGYLAPFLGITMSKVFQCIVLNGRYRSEALEETIGFRIDQIQGQADSMIDPERARQCHEELLARGNQGHFLLVPKSGHHLDERMREALKVKLAGCKRPVKES